MALTGTYERNLDAKGRLSLPAPVKESINGAVRVFPALEVDALYVFTDENYEKYLDGLFEKKGGFDPRDEEDQELRRQLNAMATPMEVDAASRIGLTEQLRAEGKLGREVTVVGNTDHLEIWDRKTWEARQAATPRAKLAAAFFKKSAVGA